MPFFLSNSRPTELSETGANTPRVRRGLALAFVGALTLAACGGGDADLAASEADAPAAAAPASDESAMDDDAMEDEAMEDGEISISTISTDLGDVLVDGNGWSLYGFTPDSEGLPTCAGDCAEAWPPVLVPGAELPEGLDSDVFSVVEGAEGGYQLVAGNWPLYRFAGDGGSGDIIGQGANDVWFLAGPDGSLIKTDPAEAAPAAVESTEDEGYKY